MYKKIFYTLFLVLSLVSFNVFASSQLIVNEEEKVAENKEPDPKNTLYIELKNGVVIAELYPTIAPRHVERIRSLTKDGFYDGLKFHRVINGFMAQTGDPTGTGRGGSSYGKLYAEFNNEHHTRGTLSMARASDPNSANSQFFIVTGEYFPELDGQYTVFGRVIEGMEYVDKIKAGDTAKNGVVENPDIMIKVVTGEMLNNKPIKTIKEEMKVINDMQAEKKKEDPNYQNKSVLDLLLKTKDIDINETTTEPTANTTTDATTNTTGDTTTQTTTNTPATNTTDSNTQNTNAVNTNTQQNTQQNNQQNNQNTTQTNITTQQATQQQTTQQTTQQETQTTTQQQNTKTDISIPDLNVNQLNNDGTQKTDSQIKQEISQKVNTYVNDTMKEVGIDPNTINNEKIPAEVRNKFNQQLNK